MFKTVMKRMNLIVGVSIIILLFTGFIAAYIWIDMDVKKNIRTAKEKYPGIAEDALIAYLLDTTNSPENRSKIAIWTLGQIQSEKAIPILNELYMNDPKGKTCKGKHDSVLCQYEIYKALKSNKMKCLPLHARLNK
jgi:hypothetical protein